MSVEEGVSFGEYAALICKSLIGEKVGKFAETSKDGDAEVRKRDKRIQRKTELIEQCGY